jgi:hypothetical protein
VPNATTVDSGHEFTEAGQLCPMDGENEMTPPQGTGGGSPNHGSNGNQQHSGANGGPPQGTGGGSPGGSPPPGTNNPGGYNNGNDTAANNGQWNDNQHNQGSNNQGANSQGMSQSMMESCDTSDMKLLAESDGNGFPTGLSDDCLVAIFRESSRGLPTSCLNAGDIRTMSNGDFDQSQDSFPLGLSVYCSRELLRQSMAESNMPSECLTDQNVDAYVKHLQGGNPLQREGRPTVPFDLSFDCYAAVSRQNQP